MKRIATFRTCGLLVVLMLLLTGCGAQARFDGNRAVSAATLEAVARRPLASWHEHRREADLVERFAGDGIMIFFNDPVPMAERRGILPCLFPDRSR